jgi:hypothetical protein
MGEEEKVRLADPGRALLLASGVNPECTARLEQVIAHFQKGEQSTIGELAGVVRASEARETDTDFAVASRLIARLLNFGVIELL